MSYRTDNGLVQKIGWGAKEWATVVGCELGGHIKRMESAFNRWLKVLWVRSSAVIVDAA